MSARFEHLTPYASRKSTQIRAGRDAVAPKDNAYRDARNAAYGAPNWSADDYRNGLSAIKGRER